MQKKLIALAVAGLVSGGAFAQSNVTVYGVMDLAVVSDGKNFAGGNTVSNRVSSGAASGSRLGFKGEEALGGNNKVFFVAETGFCADSNASASTSNGSAATTASGTGTTAAGTAIPAGASGANFCTGGNNFMGRQAVLGVTGNWGTLKGGRMYAPAFEMILAPMDPFGAGTAGQLENLMNAGVAQGNPRLNNAVAYASPTMSGFTGVVGYAPGEQAAGSNRSKGYTLGGAYGNGPLNAGLFYTRTNDAAGAESIKLTTLGVSYDFKVVKASFVYQVNKLGVSAATIDAREYMLGLTIPAGPGRVALSYVNRNDKLVANADASQTGIGYFYPLSKRTDIYTAYATISNKNAAAFTVGNATEAGTGQTGFNLGLRHTF